MTASDRPLVRRVVEDRVAILTLDSPPANAYTHAMFRQLDEHVLAARFDDDVDVVVITGGGDRFFCAGADIKMLAEAGPGWKYNFCLHANETLLRLEHTPKLVVAALNGHAVGGGLEIALACDLRLARKGGGLAGLPEAALGVLPGTGGTQRLTRLLGKSRALELMTLGTRMDFDEAARIGLVNQVLDEADFLAAVKRHVGRFTRPAAAPLALGLIKRACQSGAEMGLEQGLALERELQARLFASGDSAEGLAAFLEKRAPAFEGR